MKVCVVGKKITQFVDRETGERIEGVTLYYYAPKDEVDGFFSNSMWVKSESPAYQKAKLLRTAEPVMVELLYDIQPGKKGPVSVLVDINVNDVKPFAKTA